MLNVTKMCVEKNDRQKFVEKHKFIETFAKYETRTHKHRLLKINEKGKKRLAKMGNKK